MDNVTETTQDAVVPATGEAVPGTIIPQNATDGARVDPVPEGATGSSGNDLPKALKSDLFKLRQQRREDRAKIEELTAKIEALGNGAATVSSPTAPAAGNGKGLFDDPDTFLAERDKKLKAEAKAEVFNELHELNRAAKVKAEAVDAHKWLLSQKELDDAALDEIETLLDDPDIQAIARVSPMRAAKLVLGDWRELKGVRSSGGSPSNPRPAGLRPSAFASRPQEVFTVNEVKDFMAKYDSRNPEHQKQYQELLKAQKEGRIKK